MALGQEGFSTAFSFVLNTGIEVFPVQMKRRDNGKIAFRISRGGSGGNTIESAEEVNEHTMIKKVLIEGYAVRCSSKNRSVNGLYKLAGRSVRAVKHY